MSYMREAKQQAREAAIFFYEKIVDALLSSEKVSIDMGEYDSSYHHETHIDQAYTLHEAADVLDELHKYEETDSGLWYGQDPQTAISTMAAYTYGNAVASMWCELANEINDDSELEQLVFQYESIGDYVSQELQAAEEAYKGEAEDYEPPFDEDEEIEKRCLSFRKKIEARLSEII